MAGTKTKAPVNSFTAVFEAHRAAKADAQPPTRKRPRPDDDQDASSVQNTVFKIPAPPQQDGDSMYAASRYGELGDYMRNKRLKLQAQNQQLVHDGGTAKPQIFSKLSIYVNGHTYPSAFAIRDLVLLHGGVFHEHMDRKGMVTHIISSNLTPQKWRDWQHMKVVRPDWLVDSAEKGVLLPWTKYRLEANGGIDASQGVPSSQATFRVSARPQNLSASSSSPAPIASSSPASSSISVVPQKRKQSAEPSSSSRDLRPPRIANTAPKHVNDPVTPKTAAWRETDAPASSSSSAHIASSSPPSAQVSRATTSVVPQRRKQSPEVSAVTPDSEHPPAPALSEPPEIYTTDPVTLKDAARVPGYASFKSNAVAARKMEDPAWRAEHTAVKEGFIASYHSNSRLHLLSTFKAELRELVARAQADAEAAFTAAPDASIAGLKAGLLASPSRRDKGKRPERRVIMHCDFDCFFVSAGLVDRPHLRGKPVVVCHSKGADGAANSTSEIASSSYEARKFGIKNGMSLGQAKKLCPAVATMPYEFERYKEFSLKFYTILMRRADDLQAVSIDEALLDVSSSADAPVDLAKAIQAEVAAATGCTVSIGIADNILLARLATRRAKPAGTFHLQRADALVFLDELKVPDLHGFAWSATEKLETKFGPGATVLAEVRKKTKGALQALLGEKTGEKLWKAVRGLDDTRLESDKPRKSVSSEVNYSIRFESNEEFRKFLNDLAADVASRLRTVGSRARSLTLKLMTRDLAAPVEAPKFLGHGICDVHNKSVSLARATDDAGAIATAAWKLAEGFGFDPRELRGIGIQMQKLEGGDDRKDADRGSLKSAFGRAKAPAVSHLPSRDEVDAAVFALLPEEMQRELEAEWQRQGATAPVQDDPVAGSSKPPETPTKPKAAPSVKHITKQLAVRNRSAISPEKSALGRLFKQQQKAASVAESDSDVEEVERPPPQVLAPRGRTAPPTSSPVREQDIFDPGPVPSFSQVDPAVLPELPDDIRRELEAESARRKAGASGKPLRAMSMQPASTQETPRAGPSRSPGLSTRSRSLTPAAAMVFAGAPRNAITVSPQKAVCYIFEQKPGPPSVSNDELIHLGLHPDTFRELGPALQRDILRQHRDEAKTRQSPVKAIKALNKRMTRSPSVGVRAAARRAPPVAAQFIKPPVLVIRRGGKPVSMHTETDDVQGLLGKWVGAGGKTVPAPKDVEIFAEYLEDCVKQQTGSAAMERAVNVLRWWKLLLERMKTQTEDETVLDGWVAAFDKVKARIDVIIRARFGCPLAVD